MFSKTISVKKENPFKKNKKPNNKILYKTKASNKEPFTRNQLNTMQKINNPISNNLL